jgi:hypothetical protein
VEWIDIRYPPGGAFVKRMSNPKLHKQLEFASGHLIPTFAKRQLKRDAMLESDHLRMSIGGRVKSHVRLVVAIGRHSL